LLAKEDVDAVMIATPDHTHAVITMEALRLKKMFTARSLWLGRWRRRGA